MTGSPLPERNEAAPNSRGLIPALVLLAAACVAVLALLVIPAARSDPYTHSTLQLSGSTERGEQLFLINCAGCHGIAAQGLVGPNLHGVDSRKNDRQLIQQVVSGRTPPMPRFGAQVIAAWSHQAKLRHLGIGTQPGDAADVERPGGFHQHHGQLGGAAHTRPFM